MKPVLMIGAMREEFFSLPLKDYTLTFDGGLCSQFKYLQKISKIPTEKIFFITPSAICVGKQSHKTIALKDAYDLFHEKGDTSAFMTLEQVKQLKKQPLTRLGSHGFGYLKLGGDDLADQIKSLKKDTESMLKWFHKNLNVFPKWYSFPDNHQTLCFTLLLRKYGITEFYNGERVDVEELMKKM